MVLVYFEKGCSAPLHTFSFLFFFSLLFKRIYSFPMPAKRASKQNDRNCLVCAAATRIAHLGIDTCRACAVFYRFLLAGAQNLDMILFVALSQETEKGIKCRKCRFDHIERFLTISQPAVSMDAPSSSSTQSRSGDEQFSRPSSPTACTITSSLTAMPILGRLKTHYRTMSMVRLQGELHARPNPPHPLEISLESGPFYPATFRSGSVANRLFLSALLDFATNVFPEFGHLHSKERWDIILNNFYRLRLFEGFYRAGIVYPDHVDRIFGGYTVWMSANGMENFYDDADEENKAKAADHTKYSAARMQEIPVGRELIKRVNPCHEEFLVVVALMFWSFGDLPVRDEIAELGDRYRAAILKELHAFYRDNLRLDDYAMRLGELMSFMPVFDRTQDMKEHFETLRLLGILSEDNFIYQLQKAD